MKWIRERDALIAQTLAFVQSVAGKKDDFRQPDTATAPPVLTAEIVSVRAVTVALEQAQSEPPPQIAPTPQPLPSSPPRMAGDFRSEMQTRIANFRKHQERFEREREEYCAATLTKLRAAIRDADASPPARK
ncbi:hypothetical protein L6654_30400 [Bradyrhizobium sp. WYCCWR 13023]|uniref:Uncharacterized protein n=1 Tax=Bradyrhizobium zhengyangense TaxID=2911009 RepID=A0A9X1RGR3_9BRAD|nr:MULTISPECIES: hypothetical protein [Bradyrhizobium]MCG2630948.1 hypothetical protein [Bradyrhizobium zhengyangense]MCG2644567.1 hypothetical protein [Bradyrhizobium zhengyangense]MCG2672167.1 hypothetical protein [Bradyrhizobium zhengyangense]MDA9519735.1 hypothetical protein [Bradyrhizobium sp. CCBAU 11434]